MLSECAVCTGGSSAMCAALTPRSHRTRRPSTDDMWLFDTSMCFPGLHYQGDFIGQVYLRIFAPRDLIGRRIRRLPQKLNISQLFDAGNGDDRTDGPTMHFDAKSMRSVNGGMQCERGISHRLVHWTLGFLGPPLTAPQHLFSVTNP